MPHIILNANRLLFSIHVLSDRMIHRKTAKYTEFNDMLNYYSAALRYTQEEDKTRTGQEARLLRKVGDHRPTCDWTAETQSFGQKAAETSHLKILRILIGLWVTLSDWFKACCKTFASTNQIYTALLKIYEQIRSTLLRTYADKRDDVILKIELPSCRRSDGKSPFKFHDRMQKLLNLIAAYLQNNNPENCEVLTENYERIALGHFLFRLKEPLGSALQTRQPPDIGTALTWLSNDHHIFKGIKIIKSTQVQKPYQPTPNYNRQNPPQYRPQSNDTPFPNFLRQTHSQPPNKPKFQKPPPENSAPPNPVRYPGSTNVLTNLPSELPPYRTRNKWGSPIRPRMDMKTQF